MAASTAKNLLHLAQHGVATNMVPTFVPNGGVGCPTYPPEIADNGVLLHLINKSHRLERLIMLPRDLAIRPALRYGGIYKMHSTACDMLTNPRLSVLSRLMLTVSATPSYLPLG